MVIVGDATTTAGCALPAVLPGNWRAGVVALHVEGQIQRGGQCLEHTAANTANEARSGTRREQERKQSRHQESPPMQATRVITRMATTRSHACPSCHCDRDMPM